MAALQAEVARLQAENDQFRRALVDMNRRIVCGQLTGDLPDDFLEQFSQLPDLPLEQVLRFLPAHQVAQMRHVSHKFNNLIKKCSQTMPKKAWNGSVLFEITLTGQLTVEWFDNHGSMVNKTTLAGNEIALSELLRFIRIGGRMHFSHGLSAADEVLDQLCKAWVTIRPKVVIFAGNLSHTSRDSLKAFLVKVEPSIRWLHFQGACNIADSLLSDDVIGAAGRLDGLMIKPLCWGSELPNFNIGDDTLMSMADADHIPSYFLVMGCSGITPGGIRTFIQKWLKNERLKPDGKTYDFEMECKLAFFNCANISSAAVEEACADLPKDTAIAEAYASPFGYWREMSDGFEYLQVNGGFEYRSSSRPLTVHFSSDVFFPHLVKDPS
uniref:F-box domain-containing protein n=1 Tax=Plectus sambesii TaxID=2011161 RepID=A0A914W3E5_9BILA